MEKDHKWRCGCVVKGGKFTPCPSENAMSVDMRDREHEKYLIDETFNYELDCGHWFRVNKIFADDCRLVHCICGLDTDLGDRANRILRLDRENHP